MEIAFETERLARLCNSQAALDRAYGAACAKRLRQRLQELEAVESLADMVFGRPHELKGNRTGQLSVDLVHPSPADLPADCPAAADEDRRGSRPFEGKECDNHRSDRPALDK